MIQPVPHRLSKRVTEIGGKAPNGLPLFRVMRSCDRMTWIGGKWKRYDEHGNYLSDWVGMQEVPKYPQAKDRYIFEILCPPENYGSPAEWELAFTEYIDGTKIETLGPFPREGEYELIKVIETPAKKAFVPLTEAICDAVIATAKLNMDLPERIRREAIKDKREREEKARIAKQIDMINDICVSPTMRNPHVIVPNMEETALYGTK